ncbi:MAG: hypothetical protein JSV20_04730 [Candidatus Bathyarchaeota archaeon]|nr:MAG: hypothetical protein JSV20_04730 [Candidatus Bathyarchaeota archaeon]
MNTYLKISYKIVACVLEATTITVYRIKTWEHFKALVTSLKPSTVYYLTQPHPLRKPPLGLRLTFYNRGDIYVFIDYADAKVLHKTGIPITNPSDAVNADVSEYDIRNFLAKELDDVNLVSLPPFMY